MHLSLVCLQRMVDGPEYYKYESTTRPQNKRNMNWRRKREGAQEKKSDICYSYLLSWLLSTACQTNKTNLFWGNEKYSCFCNSLHGWSITARTRNFAIPSIQMYHQILSTFSLDHHHHHPPVSFSCSLLTSSRWNYIPFSSIISWTNIIFQK